MKLFGRELSGFAKRLVILAAIFLVASGMCGMQMVFANGGLPSYFLLLGILESIAMILSAAGIVFVLIAWAVQSLYDRHSKRQEDGLQKLMDTDEQDKKDETGPK